MAGLNATVCHYLLLLLFWFFKPTIQISFQQQYDNWYNILRQYKELCVYASRTFSMVSFLKCKTHTHTHSHTYRVETNVLLVCWQWRWLRAWRHCLLTSHSVCYCWSWDCYVWSSWIHHVLGINDQPCIVWTPDFPHIKKEHFVSWLSSIFIIMFIFWYVLFWLVEYKW